MDFYRDFDQSWFTSDIELLETSYYKEICKTIKELWKMGVIQKCANHCLGMSDIIKKLLSIKGIDSEIVECELLFVEKNGNIGLVGGETDDAPIGSMNNHVVCITKTDIPVLIDLSVFYLHPDKPFIIERVRGEDNNLSVYHFKHSDWFYSSKNHSLIPKLHQRSIVDRIKTDSEFKNNISSLKSKTNKISKYIYILFAISLLNFIRGSFDFTQKYVIRDNGFGPNQYELHQVK